MTLSASQLASRRQTGVIAEKSFVNPPVSQQRGSLNDAGMVQPFNSRILGKQDGCFRVAHDSETIRQVDGSNVQSKMIIFRADMTESGGNFTYALGSTDAEHERLVRQAKWLAPITERFFRDAGIGPGQRVIDLGSGAGDVALIAARLVGRSGEVVGIERDVRSIGRAKARVAQEGLHNVTFTQADVSHISNDKPFDAAVGRYILMFLPDPVGVLRSLAHLVRPGGVLAFQEPTWGSFLQNSARLPLWSVGASLVVETFQRTGAHTNMGPNLAQVFQDAGLPLPSTQTDTLLGAEQMDAGCSPKSASPNGEVEPCHRAAG